MDIRTPILIVLGTLLAALALSILGLAADNASYYHFHQNGDVDVHYLRWNSSANAQYSYWVKLDYAPSNFTLSKEYAEIATAVICTVTGLSIAIGAWFARSQNKTASSTDNSESESKSKIPSRFSSLFLPVALGLSILALTITLSLSIYTNTPAMKWTINFKNSLPLPPQVSNPSHEAPTEYKSPFAYTPELWNCYLAPYVVGSDSGIGAGRLAGLCQEARVARDLMVVLVVLAAALVGCLGWFVWQAKRAGAAKEMEMRAGKDVDEVSVESVSVEGGEKTLGWSS